MEGEENAPAQSEASFLLQSTGTSDDNEWSSDLETILSHIQSNCSLMSKHHKRRFLLLKAKLTPFRIILIILGSANSVFAVGLTYYLPQQTVSVINCIMSLISTIITSIELFLGIQAGMEREYIAQREFYLLAVELYSQLTLQRKHRTENGTRYLEKILSKYNRLIENSDVIHEKIADKLLPVISKIEDPEIITSSTV